MNFENIIWNKQTYQEFINYLYSLQNIKYKEFHKKLILDDNLIGIPTPKLKEIAKKITKGDYKEFIKLNNKNLYEERLIYGLIISYLNDFNEVINELNKFIPYINNWAINDIVCSNLKIFKKNQTKGFSLINQYLKSNNGWSIRFGLVLLLNFYIDDKYIHKIIKICDNIKTDDYYVMMSNAWLLSICYIKYPDITYKYLCKKTLDKTTLNKTISKICDSKRVDNNYKKSLKNLRKQI